MLVEKERMRVYLRIRPLTSAESEFGESQVCIAHKIEGFYVSGVIKAD